MTLSCTHMLTSVPKLPDPLVDCRGGGQEDGTAATLEDNQASPFWLSGHKF